MSIDICELMNNSSLHPNQLVVKCFKLMEAIAYLDRNIFNFSHHRIYLKDSQYHPALKTVMIPQRTLPFPCVYKVFCLNCRVNVISRCSYYTNLCVQFVYYSKAWLSGDQDPETSGFGPNLETSGENMHTHTITSAHCLFIMKTCFLQTFEINK